MEIRRSAFDPERSKLPEADITRPNREAIASSIEELREVQEAARARGRAPDEAAEARAERGDEIRLSERTRERAEALEKARERSPGEAARVAELKALRERGELNTDERIERAASKLLSGE